MPPKNPLHCTNKFTFPCFMMTSVLSVVADEYADESCTVDAIDDIESTAAGYQLKIQLPSVFFKYIIGKKGETKKRLESETRTQIKVPRQREEGDIGMFWFFKVYLLFFMWLWSIYRVSSRNFLVNFNN